MRNQRQRAQVATARLLRHQHEMARHGIIHREDSGSQDPRRDNPTPVRPRDKAMVRLLPDVDLHETHKRANQIAEI
jgi:hypothetical protein